MDLNDNNIKDNKSLKDIVNNLAKKIDKLERGEIQVSKLALTPEEQEIQDRARYQSLKKDYFQHDLDGKKCSIEQCLIECPYFPEDGIETEEGEIYYDDGFLDPEFLGYESAIDTRKRVAAMSPKEFEKYRQGLKWEYTAETQRAMEEGKRLYIKSGSYPTHDDPKTTPNAQYYEYKR